MKIVLLDKSCFTYQDVLELIHSAFQQWKEQGIESSVLHLSLEQFIKRTNGATVFVASDDSGNLLGTTTCVILVDDKGNNYAYNLYSAVSNQLKGSGVGTELLKAEKEFALQHHCDYIISDTSVLAPWSVKWHEKNGFRKIECKSFYYNDYYSYIFRCQLTSPSIWNNPLFTQSRFYYYYFKTKVLLRPDSELSPVGQVVSKLLSIKDLFTRRQ